MVGKVVRIAMNVSLIVSFGVTTSFIFASGEVLFNHFTIRQLSDLGVYV